MKRTNEKVTKSGSPTHFLKQVVYQLLPPTTSLASSLLMGAGVQMGSNNSVISLATISVNTTTNQVGQDSARYTNFAT